MSHACHTDAMQVEGVRRSVLRSSWVARDLFLIEGGYAQGEACHTEAMLRARRDSPCVPRSSWVSPWAPGSIQCGLARVRRRAKKSRGGGAGRRRGGKCEGSAGGRKLQEGFGRRPVGGGTVWRERKHAVLWECALGGPASPVLPADPSLQGCVFALAGIGVIGVVGPPLPVALLIVSWTWSVGAWRSRAGSGAGGGGRRAEVPHRGVVG